MPYRHAHWWILSLFPVAALAFWRNYVSQIGIAPAEMHVHGITASLWLLLLALQSWSIHDGRRSLHRSLGIASLALFPAFLAGGAGIFLGMAGRFAAAQSPFHTMYAARLAWIDVVTVGGFAFFYFQALKWRRKVHVHARYLLATALFLLPPIFGRLGPLLPPLALHGPADYWKLTYSFHLGNLLTAAIALFLATRPVKHGRPFALAALIVLISSLLYQFAGALPAWERLFAGAATLPVAAVTLVALSAGILIAWKGWQAGVRPAPPGSKALPAEALISPL